VSGRGPVGGAEGLSSPADLAEASGRGPTLVARQPVGPGDARKRVEGLEPGQAGHASFGSLCFPTVFFFLAWARLPGLRRGRFIYPTPGCGPATIDLAGWRTGAVRDGLQQHVLTRSPAKTCC